MFARALTLASALALGLGAARGEDPPAGADFAKRVGPSLALFRGPDGPATALCVHASGLFVVVESSGLSPGPCSLTLDPGLPTERTLSGRVVRHSELDRLSVVRCDGDPKCPALAIADDAALLALKPDSPVFFAGYLAEKRRPSGPDIKPKPWVPALAAGPAIALPYKVTTQGRPPQAGVNFEPRGKTDPHLPGAPFFLPGGEIAGVLGGFRGDSKSWAGRLRDLLARPVVELFPPPLTAEAAGREAEFRAFAASIDPKHEPRLELILDDGTTRRRVPMAGTRAEFTAKAIPLPAGPRPETVRLEARFADGLVSGELEDGPLGRDRRWSDVERVSFRDKEARLPTGRVVPLAAGASDGVTLRVGGQRLKLLLGDAEDVRVSYGGLGSALRCTLVVTAAGREVERVERVVAIGGRAGGWNDLKQGRVFRPAKAAAPTTYLKVMGDPADPVAKGVTFEPAPDRLEWGYNSKHLAIRLPPGGRGDEGWRFTFAGPHNQHLREGEFLRTRHARDIDRAGMEVAPTALSPGHVTGRFSVWELEVEGFTVTKAAIDFVQYGEGSAAPMYGRLRLNSSYE